MADEKTGMSERFIKLHELVDTINMNISYLKAHVLDSRESRKVMQQFSEMDKLIAALQTELSEVKRKYLEPEYPEPRNKRWKTAPTC